MDYDKLPWFDNIYDDLDDSPEVFWCTWCNERMWALDPSPDELFCSKKCATDAEDCL